MTTNNENKLMLSIEKTLSEKAQPILKAMENNFKILLNSRMKTGKTYLTANIISKYFNNKGIKVLFISPVNLLIEQHIKRYGDFWAAQNSKYKSNVNDMSVITTPDSLPKEIEKCKEHNKKFVLIVDEAHEVEASQKFRKAFKNIEEAENNNLCVNITYLTATPDNILNSINNTFDKIINIKQDDEDMFLNGDIFELMTLKTDISNKVELLKAALKEYDQVFYKVDSYKTLEKITKILNMQGLEDHTFLTSNNREENEISSYIENDEIINHKYKLIGLTSFINSGIEIKTAGRVCVINFSNSTYNFINEIQMIGRFRNGVEKYILTIPPAEENKSPSLKVDKNNPFIKSYEEIEENLKESTEIICNAYNEILTNEKTKNLFKNQEIENMINPHPGIIFDELKRQCKINKTILSNEIYRRYEEQFLIYPELLLNKFKNHNTLKFNKFILNEEGILKVSSKTIKALEELKKDEEKEKNQFKEDLKNCCNELLKLNSDTRLKILKFDPVGLSPEEMKIYNYWYELTEIKEDIIKTLKDLEEKEIDLLQAFNIFTEFNGAKIKRIDAAFKGITGNKLYDNNRKELIKMCNVKSKKESNHYKQIYKIREYIDGQFKNGTKISNKHIENIALLYKSIGLLKNDDIYIIDKDKKRKLNIKVKTNIISFLQSICIMSEEKSGKNKTYYFSSIRKNLNDLIC